MQAAPCLLHSSKFQLAVLQHTAHPACFRVFLRCILSCRPRVRCLFFCKTMPPLSYIPNSVFENIVAHGCKSQMTYNRYWTKWPSVITHAGDTIHTWWNGPNHGFDFRHGHHYRRCHLHHDRQHPSSPNQMRSSSTTVPSSWPSAAFIWTIVVIIIVTIIFWFISATVFKVIAIIQAQCSGKSRVHVFLMPGCSSWQSPQM